MKKMINAFIFCLLALIVACDWSVSSDGDSIVIDDNDGPIVTSFYFSGDKNPGLTGDAVGQVSGKQITVTVPYAADLTSLIPTIVVSEGTASIPDGSAKDFTEPLQFTVSSGDSIKLYVVFVSKSPIDAKEITSFSFKEAQADVEIQGSDIYATVPWGTDLNLTPVIAYTGSGISPASGVMRDFSSPVTYVVTAADGTTAEYTVYVSDRQDSSKEITSFRFSSIDADATISGTQITINVPDGTDLHLEPVIEHNGESMYPPSGEIQDFSSPVEYIVTAENGSTAVYTVTVKTVLSDAKEIEAFYFTADDNPDGLAGVSAGSRIDGVIDDDQITVLVPYGSILRGLTPRIEHTGSFIDPESGVARDFRNEVIYSVTAADGTVRDYCVAVAIDKTTAPSGNKEIQTFEFRRGSNPGIGLDLYGQIDGNFIRVLVPHTMTDQIMGSLVPTITTSCPQSDEGLSPVFPESGEQQDFTQPVTYIVTAQDGTTKSYTVKVERIAVKSFMFARYDNYGSGVGDDLAGVIGDSEIVITVPYGTDLTFLKPAVEFTGNTLTPAAGSVVDFSGPVTYTVDSGLGFSRSYLVRAQYDDKITYFAFEAGDNEESDLYSDVIGTVSDSRITISVPCETDISNLVPRIEFDGQIVVPASGMAQDFTEPVTYTLHGHNGAIKEYSVTVTRDPSYIRKIESFGFYLSDGSNAERLVADSIGTIKQRSISVVLPYGSSRYGIVPRIGFTGARIVPDPDLSMDFSTPVTYTVVSENGMETDYTVSVTIAKNTAKEILSFTLREADNTIPNVYNDVVGNIVGNDIYLGFDIIPADLTALKPTIGITGVSVNPPSGVSNDFTSTAVYTVTAADGTTRNYTVHVACGRKYISGFSFNTADNSSLIKSIQANQSSDHYGSYIDSSTNSIVIRAPRGMNLSSLRPTITLNDSGAQVSPASGTANNFTSGARYTVTAQDHTTKTYLVQVDYYDLMLQSMSFSTTIGTSYTINAVISNDNSTITGNLPSPYRNSNLIAAFSLPTHAQGAVVLVNGVQQTSGTTVNSFSGPVVYTVRGEDGSTRNYTARVPRKYVYSAGAYNDGIRLVPCYWRNTTRYSLSIPTLASSNTNASEAKAIIVSGSNVYVAGHYNNGTRNIACLWINGTRVELESAGYTASAKSMYLVDNYLYVCGTYTNGSVNTANYWKYDLSIPPQTTPPAGQCTRVALESSVNSTVFDISVYGTSVNIAGCWSDSSNIYSGYWVYNSSTGSRISRTQLASSTAAYGTIATTIYNSGSTVYTGGWFYNGTNGAACFWTNTTQTTLTSNTASGMYNGVFGMTRYESVNYFSGHYYNGTIEAPCYWYYTSSTSTRRDLPISYPAQASAVALVQYEIFCSGIYTNSNERATFWVGVYRSATSTDYSRYDLSSGVNAHANDIYVVTQLP